MIKDKRENTFKIICPFCSSPYTAEMEVDVFGGGGGCESCGDGGESSVKIEVKCENCKKTVYIKEVDGNY